MPTTLFAETAQLPAHWDRYRLHSTYSLAHLLSVLEDGETQQAYE